MFGKMMNGFYYGKSGKGDYRPEDLPKTRYNIVIEPQMSFGSGHHQTTTMIIAQLLEDRKALKGKLWIPACTASGIQRRSFAVPEPSYPNSAKLSWRMKD